MGIIQGLDTSEYIINANWRQFESLLPELRIKHSQTFEVPLNPDYAVPIERTVLVALLRIFRVS